MGLKSLFFLFLLPSVSFSMTWQDLWFTPDQQGAKLLQQNKPEQAARHFKNPLWKGVASYRAGDYQKAEKAFATSDSALAHYNRGNALAHRGQYQAAIHAYDQALQKNPNMQDAKYNKKLLEQLLRKKQQENKKQQQTSLQKNQSNSNKKNNNSPQHNLVQKDSTPNAPKQQQPLQKESDSTQAKNLEKQKNNFSKSPEKQMNFAPTPKDQKIQQWLQQIPDDPGGLLRQKFLRDHYRSVES